MSLDRASQQLADLFGSGLLIPSADFDIENLPDGRQRVHERQQRTTAAPATSISGCTDPSASNYDPLANVDNGSCIYTGACCDWDGTCTEQTEADCIANTFFGVFHGAGTTCLETACTIGACCYEDGSCAEQSQASCEPCCPSGVYQGDATSCDPNPCPPPTGACCYPDPENHGFCTPDMTQSDCESDSGVYEGDGSVCPCSRFKGYTDFCTRFLVQTTSWDMDDPETGAYYHVICVDTLDPETCEVSGECSGGCRSVDAEEGSWDSELCANFGGLPAGDCIDYAISNTVADVTDEITGVNKHCELTEQYWP